MEFLSSSYQASIRDSLGVAFVSGESFSFPLSLSLHWKSEHAWLKIKPTVWRKTRGLSNTFFTVSPVLFFRHYERIPRWIFTSGPRQGFKDPPPSSPHSRFHPLFSLVFIRGRRVVASWHLLLSLDPSTRPSNPSFSSNPSFLLPSSLSFSFLFAFFIFFDFSPLTRQRHFPSALSVLFFFLSFFYYSCLWLLVSLSRKGGEEKKRDGSFSFDRFVPGVERGDVFHRTCVAPLPFFEASMTL